MPASLGERPSLRRVYTTKQISDKGNANTNSGIIHVTFSGCVANVSLIPRMPTMKPKTNAPMSPMKVLAGLKLYTKKPSVLPHKAAARLLTKTCPCKMAITMKKKLAIAVKPAAKPSMLSKKFTAFINVTNHKTEMATSKMNTRDRLIRTSLTTSMSATKTIAPSLVFQLNS